MCKFKVPKCTSQWHVIYCYVAQLFHHFTKSTAPILGELISKMLNDLHNNVLFMTNIIVTVNFSLLSDVSFLLTCNSTGGPVDSMIWTRDGFLLDNTEPLVLTNVSTASYTNVLQVNNGTLGTYTCQTRGSGGQLLGSTLFAVLGIKLAMDRAGNLTS